MLESRCGEKPICARKYSKNKKKNWRKFTNVKDVEQFLEEKRREDKFGIPSYEKTDQQLFVVDDNPVTSADVRNESAILQPWKKKSFQMLRSEVNLYADPSVSPISFPRPKKQRGKRALMLDGYQDSSDSDHDHRSHKEIRRDTARLLNSIRQRKARKIDRHIKSREGHDVWKEEGRRPMSEIEEYYLQVTKNKPTKRPVSARIRPSGIKNVEPPPPGASYNPSIKDHQELLKMATVRLEKAQKKELKYLKKTDMPTMHLHERESIWKQEMKEGIEHLLSSGCTSLPSREDEHTEEEEQNNEVVGCRAVRSEDRKTRKQRRKEREAKEIGKCRRDEKLTRIRMGEVMRIKSIKKEILQQELVKQRRHVLRQEHRKKDIYRTKRLGRHRYEEPDPDLKLSKEVVGSLRCLEPEGNIARDRYKNFEKRNMVEPKGPRLRSRYQKKAKIRWTEKRSVRLDRDIVKWQ